MLLTIIKCIEYGLVNQILVMPETSLINITLKQQSKFILSRGIVKSTWNASFSDVLHISLKQPQSSFIYQTTCPGKLLLYSYLMTQILFGKTR